VDRTIKILPMLALGLCGLSLPAAAADPTAGQVHSWCMAKNRDQCITYISALRAGFVLGDSSQIVNGRFVDSRRSNCIPNSDEMADGALTAKVFTLMTLDFGAYPEDRNEPAPGFLAGVMIHAFPCK
jgi:hypothetical protein